MKKLLKTSAFLLGCAAVIPLTSQAGTVFNDTFGSGSTVNGSAFTPTANSTYYETASAKGGGVSASSIAPGKLVFGVGQSSSSAPAELQALFPAVTLNNVGDYADLTIVFQPTGILTPSSGHSATFNVGMANSFGVGPLENGVLANAGMSGGTNFARGGAQLWQGYSSSVGTNGTVDFATRPEQIEATDLTGNDNNGNQDIVLNGSVTGSYRNPKGTSLGSGDAGTAIYLADGSTYTLDYKLTLSAPGTLTVQNSLYSGSGVNAANQIYSLSASDTSPLTTTFDALGLGFREEGTDGSISIGSIKVSAVPEPSTFALAGLGLLSLLWSKRRRFAR